MIDGLSANDTAWLSAFFAAPNELSWDALTTGAAPQTLAEQIRPWLQLLANQNRRAPIILPFVRGGGITGWYATTQGAKGRFELAAEIEAWLGPAYLSFFEAVPTVSSDPMAASTRARFGGTVYRFAGSNPTTNVEIAARISDYLALLTRRPAIQRRTVRPVGSIRADFEGALLARDESYAERMVAELKQTGRLNEENLRYLDVRLKAGLGLWPQIARDHWLIHTISDLALPPQILSDIIEALYRTYIDEVEAAGDPSATLHAFDQQIVKRYPRLFASRRGIRTPRVVKAFVLYEQLQFRPSSQIVADLLALLPEVEGRALLVPTPASAPAAIATQASTEADAEEAFDDAQFDRAFALYLAGPMNRKSITRMIYCVQSIGTVEAKQQLLAAVDGAHTAVVASLPSAAHEKLEALRATTLADAEASVAEPRSTAPEIVGWMRWAATLQRGDDLASAERALQDAATNWDITPFQRNESLSQELADMIGNLGGAAGAIARRAVPQIFASFFPQGTEAAPAIKPIAAVLFVLIAMDDRLSRTDLNLLAQLLTHLLALGLVSDEYISYVRDLEDVQRRVGSYAHLPWSLDIGEALATAPCPSDAARDARLRLYLQVLGQAQSFAHRLGPQDLLPIEYLAKDYGVVTDAIATLKRNAGDEGAGAALPSFEGKTIGIYTLSESAGSRAKLALEQMFPSCSVVVNSDLVCTARLTSLATVADLFVFAWKSSSHQAFYCVKDALTKSEPVWALGKGTASILRAVLDSIQ